MGVYRSIIKSFIVHCNPFVPANNKRGSTLLRDICEKIPPKIGNSCCTISLLSGLALPASLPLSIPPGQEKVLLLESETIGGRSVSSPEVENYPRIKRVSGLFISVGQIPENQQFADIATLDPAGYIVAGEDCKTSGDGIFAAGDCRTKEVRQLTTAAADGAVAGLAACQYVAEHFPS